ncbi:MAG: hypothetical protein GY781_21475 [Gammaproteobacteria bacterium]|nr:hypothetical protein [Gammaproteobacteria bacterium]
MKSIITWIAVILLCTISFNSEAAKKKKPRFKPYYLASTQVADFSKIVTDTREIIKQSQFSLVGDFSPYENAHVFAITHESLLNSAAQSEFGGYGAVIRVGVTATEKGVQVSYVNPVYMTNLYHIPEVPDVAAELAKVFGEGETFGSKRGKSKRSLKNYQYMMFMPEFDDHDKLGTFDSQQEALATVNGNLSSGNFKLTKVFEVAIPGKDEVLIGVTIGDGEGADSVVMPIVDSGEIKHTAHLPYAVLVSDGTVYAQAGKFRIASAFPDLGMGTFMKISDAPDGIKNSLKQLTTK